MTSVYRQQSNVMDTFYITLPSTASSQVYQNNQSRFRVRLPQPMALDGEWKVGLSEIHIPTIFNNIGEETDAFNIYIQDKGPRPETFIQIPNYDFEGTGFEPQLHFIRHVNRQIPKELQDVIRFSESNEGGPLTVKPGYEVQISDQLKVMLGMKEGDESLYVHKRVIPSEKYWLVGLGEGLWIKIMAPSLTKKHALKIPHGYYAKVEHILQAMTDEMPKEVQDHILFHVNRDGTVSITCKPTIRLKFPSSRHGLGTILGFVDTKSQLPAMTKGDYSADLRSGVYGLYVYSDLVQPHIVGDTFSSLLRVIPLQDVDKYTSTYVKIYTTPDYYPIMQNHFETIEIDIRADSGEQLKFRNGKTLVKLAFQKV